MMKKDEKIDKYYKLEEVLGELEYYVELRRGSFAVVKRAIRKKTGEEVAVKIFKR